MLIIQATHLILALLSVRVKSVWLVGHGFAKIPQSRTRSGQGEEKKKT